MLNTQNKKILEYMKERGEITSFIATIDLGIVALTTRISELKAAGWDIGHRRIKSQNRDGRDICYNSYFLQSLFNLVTGDAI